MEIITKMLNKVTRSRLIWWIYWSNISRSIGDKQVERWRCRRKGGVQGRMVKMQHLVQAKSLMQGTASEALWNKDNLNIMM